ncbi:hypothetical protein ABZY09_47525 [Streptomyces sp. NPDC002928]|uniref:hypothetical protein n=1 Tax=Streptomyces sp. NPDC002928 TaxID=3154440 RepID=UPI0033ADDC8B
MSSPFNAPQPKQPARVPIYKRKGFWVGVVVLTVIGAVANGTKEQPSADSNEAAPTPTVTVTQSAEAPQETQAAQEEDSSDAEPAVETGDLPDFTGMVLQDAQDTAQAAGFYNLRDKDASGQDRFQVLDSNWKVCSQEPASGSHALGITVTMYAVKLTESC